MAVINVRKARAGTDSAGHRWPTDGAVIEVPVEHALALTRIPDGGFSIIETPLADKLAPEAPVVLTEVEAESFGEVGTAEAKARPARTTARKA